MQGHRSCTPKNGTKLIKIYFSVTNLPTTSGAEKENYRLSWWKSTSIVLHDIQMVQTSTSILNLHFYPCNYQLLSRSKRYDIWRLMREWDWLCTMAKISCCLKIWAGKAIQDFSIINLRPSRLILLFCQECFL